MKNTITFLVYILLTLASACTQKDDTGLTGILSEVRTLAKAEKKIIVFFIELDKRSGLYRLTGYRIVKNSKEIIDFVEGAHRGATYIKKTFQIVCTDTNGDTSYAACIKQACIANTIAICMENTNKVTLHYYPPKIE